MILINLLPHREIARKRRKDAFNATLVASALVGVVIAGAIYTWFQSRIEAQQARNNLLKQETQVLEGQIKQIATLEAEITALRARQQAVEDLQADRNLPVHLLNELVKQIPDGVFIASMKQDGQTVLLQGSAQSNERVSDMLRNLGNNTPWLTRPELVEIVSANLVISPREQRRVANFNVRVGLVRSAEAQKAAASAAVGAASAAKR